MLQSYRLPKANEASMDLAKKITALVVASTVTYEEAENALEAVQDLLMKTTRPVHINNPQQHDAEQIP